MKYYIIVGEASGDLHASNLMRAIKEKDPAAEFRFWGGDLMQQQGGTLVKHYKDLAFMGFVEVLANLRTILSNIRLAKRDILADAPDVVILVDYPGFNLRISEFTHKKGIKTVYYISPQLWAWKEGRVKSIKKTVDRMLVILPFEKEFYAGHGYEVDFVGHPLLDAVKDEGEMTPRDVIKDELLLDSRPVVALLPGSRRQEIKKMLPVMCRIRNAFPDYQFIVAGAPSQPFSFYRKILRNSDISVVSGRTYDILSVADAACVTSGTATLETALYEVPEVVCYKGSRISYWIGKRLIKVPFISLVNLVMGREVVRELIQDDFNVQTLTEELSAILGGKKREKMLEDYRSLEQNLGGGNASQNAARLIVGYLKEK